MSIQYSEIFKSIQGEGHYTGVPTMWVRFFLCNLQCNGFGQKDPTDPSTHALPYKEFDVDSVERIEDLPVWEFGCDSSYSWSTKYRHLQHNKTAAEICDTIEQMMRNDDNPLGLFRHPKSRQEQHLCFTGGEPLLPVSQRAVIEILTEFKRRNNTPKYITFETNGTQELRDDLVEYFNTEYPLTEVFFSVSPKLFTVSGEKSKKAIKPERAAKYTQLVKNSEAQLKPVLGLEERQWEEWEEVHREFRNYMVDIEWPVWIMPLSATVEGQNEIAAQVAEKAIEKGYNVSARVHCYLWGNQIGT